ncbi:hypothetical protein B0H16DRAFT_1455195 [Mycena metata]|uniref:Uncharacterized protein n=1 Tax=Mycena metata TaxID=1033252 RepID=A0AAD7JFH1_9AGAR|nr:hypothetical protein B0H16DRAFT_1455195 [Mycena metata]
MSGILEHCTTVTRRSKASKALACQLNVGKAGAIPGSHRTVHVESPHVEKSSAGKVTAQACTRHRFCPGIGFGVNTNAVLNLPELANHVHIAACATHPKVHPPLACMARLELIISMEFICREVWFHDDFLSQHSIVWSGVSVPPGSESAAETATSRGLSLSVDRVYLSQEAESSRSRHERRCSSRHGAILILKEHQVDVVLSTIKVFSVPGQKSFVDCAKEAGVKLFVPSKFKMPTKGQTEDFPGPKNEFAGCLKTVGIPSARIFMRRGLSGQHNVSEATQLELKWCLPQSMQRQISVHTKYALES